MNMVDLDRPQGNILPARPSIVYTLYPVWAILKGIYFYLFGDFAKLLTPIFMLDLIELFQLSNSN
jgi:hypothetical protein